jgi:hypothetical protein
MTERQLLQTFVLQIKDMPGLFIHKIGDTFGGHKKPADCFGVYKGKGFLLEAKKYGGILSEYQNESLKDYQAAGGVSLILTFIKYKESERNIRMHIYGSPGCFYIFYEKGKYLINENTFNAIFLRSQNL